MATLAMGALLISSASRLEIESLLWGAAILSGLAALTPLAPLKRLRLCKYFASTAASILGTLLVFLSSLSFGIAANTGRALQESDERWIVFSFIAAVVAMIATGVLVCREDRYERHRERCMARHLAQHMQAHSTTAKRIVPERRLGPVAWIATGVVLGLAWRRVGTR